MKPSWPLWISEAIYSSFRIVTVAPSLSDWKTASFEWSSEQEKTLQEVQDAVQAALSLGLYDPADPMVLVVSVADRGAVWSLL